MRAKILLHKATWKMRRGYAHLRRGWGRVFRRPALFTDGYTIEDNSTVKVYASHSKTFDSYSPFHPLQSESLNQHVKVSLVVRGGCEDLEDWEKHLFRQTRLPDEIVLVDTGVDEAYSGLLMDLTMHSPVPVTVISSSNSNIAQARNFGVLRAKYNVIIMMDLEVRPCPDWLEKLVVPFEIDPQTQVAFGRSRCKIGGDNANSWRRSQDMVAINPQAVLPTSDSLAFTKETWAISGGYPEWLDGPGADTLFAVELKRFARRWAFVPDALLGRKAPDSFKSFWRMIALESRGDGATGVQADVYWRIARDAILVSIGLFISLIWLIIGFLIKNLIVSGLGALALAGLIAGLPVREWIKGYSLIEAIWRIGVWPARVTGFLKGRKNCFEVTRSRLRGVDGIMFILSGVPIDDTGGGSRYSQIAQELLRRKFGVVYIYRYPKDESVDIPYKFSHPNLFCYSYERFSLDEFLQGFSLDLSGHRAGVLVEMPHPDWLPLIASLKHKGVRLIYDLVDDWNTDLGAAWYSPGVENQIVQDAYRLVATAPSLVNHLEKVAARPVTLLPNAVNLNVFSLERQYTRPADWPDSEWAVIYTGSLYGSWFDWDLLVEVARYYPQAAVVVIGDYRGQCPEDLPNLHFLGLKANRELPAYLAYSTVAIIPWKINNITEATNPIKLYEYLAMGKPVVAPALPTLKDIPGLICVHSRKEFVETIGKARRVLYDLDTVMRFVQENSWQARVNQLLGLLS
jgi:glycosyltransferase involved in cell wall biosynthesis